jgi:hypothetical protein
MVYQVFGLEEIMQQIMLVAYFYRTVQQEVAEQEHWQTHHQKEYIGYLSRQLVMQTLG